MFWSSDMWRSCSSVVEHPTADREVLCSNPTKDFFTYDRTGANHLLMSSLIIRRRYNHASRLGSVTAFAYLLRVCRFATISHTCSAAFFRRRQSNIFAALFRFFLPPPLGALKMVEYLPLSHREESSDKICYNIRINFNK